MSQNHYSFSKFLKIALNPALKVLFSYQGN